MIDDWTIAKDRELWLAWNKNFDTVAIAKYTNRPEHEVHARLRFLRDAFRKNPNLRRICRNMTVTTRKWHEYLRYQGAHFSQYGKNARKREQK